jgi:hypothetical protein
MVSATLSEERTVRSGCLSCRGEANEFIEKRTQEYKDRDNDRIVNRSRYESELKGVHLEQRRIEQYLSALPYATRGMLLEVTGDTKNVQNLLSQTDKLATQTAPVIAEQQRESYRPDDHGRWH